MKGYEIRWGGPSIFVVWGLLGLGCWLLLGVLAFAAYLVWTVAT